MSKFPYAKISMCPIWMCLNFHVSSLDVPNFPCAKFGCAKSSMCQVWMCQIFHVPIYVSAKIDVPNLDVPNFPCANYAWYHTILYVDKSFLFYWEMRRTGCVLPWSDVVSRESESEISDLKLQVLQIILYWKWRAPKSESERFSQASNKARAKGHL